MTSSSADEWGFRPWQFLLCFGFFGTMDLARPWIHGHFSSPWSQSVAIGFMWGLFFVLLNAKEPRRTFLKAALLFALGVVAAPVFHVKWSWWIIGDLAAVTGIQTIINRIDRRSHANGTL